MEIRHFPIRPELIELLVGLVAGAISYRFLRRGAGLLSRIAPRRARWVVVFALLGPGIRLALLPLAPPPFPVVHDEFVHLLEADTLLHGRLANPPHALPEFFETIYVIHSPTYAASYPPGLAAFWALGWKLTGTPWAGVWLAMVLCCGAVAWMLYRWLPPRAAWIGGLLCSLTWGTSSWWMNNYFGGAVPAAGGAMLFGALPALLRTARWRYALIVSAGWTLVWFTRPYESLLLGFLIAAAILRWLWRRRERRLFAAAALIFGVVMLDVAGLCYQNRCITGDPLLSPYRLTQRRYGVPHAFLWQREIPEPAHLTAQQRRMYLYQRTGFRDARSLAGRWTEFWKNMKKVWAFFIGYPLTIPLALSLWARGKARTLWLLLGLGILWSSLYPKVLVNYLAPETCLFFALASYGLLSLARHGSRGALLAVALVFASCAASVRLLYPWYLYGGPQPPPPHEAVARRLASVPGPHLVFVRYGPEHNVHDEWVYNGADIDASKVVWANDLGDERNRELIRYFAGRRVWLVQPDEGARLSAVSEEHHPADSK
ncbi:MAG: hypothetical protein ABSH47_10585 [Bryobacteraceae bacterium]